MWEKFGSKYGNIPITPDKSKKLQPHSTNKTFFSFAPKTRKKKLEN